MKHLWPLFLLISLLNFTASGAIVAHWSADGNTVESITSATGAASGVVYTGGHVGQAFNFTGAANVNFGPAFGNFGNGDFTVEFWIRTTASGKQAILNKRPICDAYNMIDFRLWPGGAIRFEVAESPYCYGYALGGHVNDGAYHHVVGVRSGATLLLYIDGVLAGSGSDPFVANVTSSSSVVIGQGPCSVDGTMGFIGQLDEITFYNEALAVEKVIDSYAPDTLSFVTQPQNRKVLQGTTATFSGTATGSGSITYQWRFNGSDIAGATATNLTIAAAQPSDAGTYTLVAFSSTNSITSTGAVLQVNVVQAPQPLNPIAWWKAEGNGADSVGVYDATQINCEFAPGVSGQSFFFHDAETVEFPSEAGNFGTNDFSVSFWFKVNNGMSALVAKRPTIDEYNVWQFSTDWGNVVFEVAEDPINSAYVSAPYPLDNQLHHVVGVRKGVDIFLYIDGKLVGTAANLSRANVTSDATVMLADDVRHGIDGVGVLTGQIDELQMFDQALSDADVFGLYSPNGGLFIVQQPVDTIIVANDSGTLTVNAVSGGPLAYQWQKNGSDITDATDSALTINSAQESDSGTYRVLITDASGATTASASAEVLIIPLSGLIIPDVIARWPGEGDATDATGTGHDAVFCNASFGPGLIGQAFYFNGSGGQNVNFGDQTLNFGTSDFTVSFYLKASRTRSRIMIMGKRSVCDDNNMFDFRVMETGEVIFEVGDHPGYGEMAIGGRVDGGWHHWAGVRKGNDAFLYEDGVLVAQTSLPWAPNASNGVDFQFGMDPCWGVDGTFPLNGAIDEVEAYGRALSHLEVFALSHPAALAPRITQQPADLNPALGDKPTFKVTATGHGPFQYQWKLNGVDIAGATKSSLALGTITAAQAGQYSVQVTTRFGSVISQVATLNIILSPGTYNGLFVSEDGSDDTSGGFTLTLNRSKTFTGVLLQHGARYSFSGRMPDNGTTIAAPGGFNLNLHPILGGDYDTIRGSVKSSKGQSVLLSRHTRPTYLGAAPQLGKHTLALPTIASDSSAPNGSGFGNVSVGRNGALTVGAVLADDTAVLASSALTKNGEWPVYIPLYRGAGSISGWVNVTNTAAGSCTGLLRWNKTATYGKYHPKPFSTKVPVTGSTFTAPTSGLGVDLNNASVILKSAADGLQVTHAGVNGTTVTFDGSNGTATFNTSNGRFAGKHYDPKTKISSPIKGVVLQQQQVASGYFLSVTNSGLLLMEKK